jgi:hypothetical protein
MFRVRYVLSLIVLTLFATIARSETAINLATAYGPDWKTLPDWRGVWYLEGPALFPGAEHSVIAKSPAKTSAPKTPFANTVTPGSYFTGAPYKPEFQKLYDERIAKARDHGIVEDPVDTCYLPHGMPRLMGGVNSAMEFLVTPDQTWILWDAMNETRRIYTDGRSHPPEDLSWPRIMGHSVGRWEGQTLIVDTILTKEGIYDRSGAPHSDQLKITERISKRDAATIVVDMTIEDPVMFTKPWRVVRHLSRSKQRHESVPGTYCDYDYELPK